MIKNLAIVGIVTILNIPSNHQCGYKPKFHYAKTFSHGLCIVENLEQFGLIDKKGNFILDFQDTPLKSFEVNESDLILHSNKQNNDISATIKDYFKDGFPKINSKDLVWSQ